MESAVPNTTSPIAIGHSGWRRRLETACVWSVYAPCLGYALGYVVENAVNVPFGDDWDMVWWTTGKLPVTWDWLWSQHNEHRIPMPRLLLLAAFRWSGGDFRVGCYIVLAMLAGLAAVLICAARRVRGHSAWTDAIFPLVLLHLGHWENLLWSFQVQFAGSVLLAGIALALIIRHGSGPERGWEVAATGICSLALCGFGASGVVFAPFIAVWQIAAAWHGWRTGEIEARRRSAALFLSAVATLSAVAYYFAGWQRQSHHPPPPTKWAAVETALQFLSIGMSQHLQAYWPASGWLVPLLLVAAGLWLLFIFWREPAERVRSLGLLLFLGGFLSMAAGIGWGRAGLGWRAGFTPRYVTLSAISVIFAYAVALYARDLLRQNLLITIEFHMDGRRRPYARSLDLRALLCCGMLLAYYTSIKAGDSLAGTRTALLREFENGLRSGTRSVVLAERYSGTEAIGYGRQIHPSAEALTEYILHLRRLGVGAFQPAAADGDRPVPK